MIEKQTFVIQACFPEVYFACHTRHHTGSGATPVLSARDSSLLAHIAGLDGIETGELARHLGRAKSTLSAALKKLEALKLIRIDVPASDSRRRKLRITPAGRDWISQTSVLETDRLTAVLKAMKAEDRELAVRGLELLAGACRTYSAKEGKSPW